MDKIWKSKWIMDKEFYGLIPINVFHKEMDKPYFPSHREDLKNRHMLVRKKFNISSNFQSAYIDITADDYYKLYINGKYVGQGPAPSYYFKYNYNRYDIRDFLKSGDNIIAVHIYYQGLINRVWNSGDYRQGMIAELYIDNNLYLLSDSTWKYIISKAYKSRGTIGYDTQYVEDIDSRFWQTGWNDIGFDDSKWEYTCENIADDHKLYLQPTPSVEVYEVKPEKVEKIGTGHYFIDFGHEITGQFKMQANGKDGDIIEIRCGEELEEGCSKHVRYDMRCNCKYQEFWTLSGREDDVLENYDYKAFRYVEVIGRDEAINPENFSAIVRHYPFDEEKCRFNSSNELLNSIWFICSNGIKYGSQEVFVDCPSREKGQYLGDVTVTAQSHIYLSGDLRLFKKAIEDFAVSTFISPGIMAVAPGSLMQEIADYSFQWPMQLLIYYMHSGDMDFLKRMYPVAEGVLNYFKYYSRFDGLLENITEKWNLVDWPENLRDDYDFKLDKPVGKGCHNVANAFYCGMVKTINTIRDILNIEYEDEFPRLKDAFIRTFYNKNTGLFVDAEGSNHSALHSNALPLLYNLAPNEAQDSIVEFIKKKKLCCGVYMSYFVLKALAKAGEYDFIYELITSQDEHSWGNMLKEGATTCFEVWGKEQKWNTSLCHPWASAPIPVLIEDIIGLKPGCPGWEQVEFDPHIPDSITSLQFKLRVKTGQIKVQYQNGSINIQCPEGVKLK